MDSPTRNRDRIKRQIRFKTTMHGTVVWQVMLWRGWVEVDDDYDWDVFWCAQAGAGLRCMQVVTMLRDVLEIYCLQASNPSCRAAICHWQGHENSCAQCRRLPTAGLQAQSCEHLWPTAHDSCVLKHRSMCTGIRSMCRSDVLSVGVDSGFDHGKLIDRQRLNHFPRHMELTRKDLMVKNLKKWKRAMVKQGKPVNDFWPTTFRLPEVLLPCLARAAEQCRNNICRAPHASDAQWSAALCCAVRLCRHVGSHPEICCGAIAYWSSLAEQRACTG